MPDFTNTEIAFRHLSKRQLKRNLRIFRLVRHAWLIKIGKPLLQIGLAVHFPLQWILGGIYRHFVGGKDLKSAIPVFDRLNATGVKSIADFSVEGKGTEDSREAVCAEIIASVHFAAAQGNKNPFAVFKPSGISCMSLLAKKSAKQMLNPDEEQQWRQTTDRWDRVFSAAASKRIPVMVDAEESWIQQAVDDLVFHFMLKYNRDFPVVFNTLQMYRHDRLAFLQETIAFAKNNSLQAGIKFVRGAYHEKENRYAKAHGVAPAVYQRKPETDQAFNEALSMSVQHIDVLRLMCASHNEESAMHLTRLIQEHGLAKNDSRIWFAQLYGMSDHISFNLADEGYNVAKYVPYAPIRNVMPYLIRRAEENTSVKGQTLRELSLLEQEIKRRNC